MTKNIAETLIDLFQNTKFTLTDALSLYSPKSKRNHIELKTIPIIEFWNDIVAQMTI